jgi:hypothetical protein
MSEKYGTNEINTTHKLEFSFGFGTGDVEGLLAETLSEIEERFKVEVGDTVSLAAPNYEALEKSPDWEVVNLSDQIPQAVKTLVEISHRLALLKGKENSDAWNLLSKEARELLSGDWRHQVLDMVSDKCYLDTRNFNHTILGHAMASDFKSLYTTPFDVGKPIFTGPSERFYLNVGNNPYQHLHKPLMISTSYNPGMRAYFIEMFGGLEKIEERISNFFAKQSGFNHGSNKEIHSLENNREGRSYYINPKRDRIRAENEGVKLKPSSSVDPAAGGLLFLAGLTKANDGAEIELRLPNNQCYFHELFDVIIDLRAGKKFRKLISDQSERVCQEMVYIRELIEKSSGLKL